MLKPFDNGKRARSRTKCRLGERECATRRELQMRERKPSFPAVRICRARWNLSEGLQNRSARAKLIIR